MSRAGRARIALTVVAALVAGGVAGAGVGLRWYGSAAGVGLAVLCGLGAGGVVLRAALRARRARGAEGAPAPPPGT